MAISTVGSWLPTIDEFSAHWTAVNAYLSSVTPLAFFQLSGSYKLSNLTADRTALATAINDVVAKENLRQNAAGDRDVKRAALRPRLVQFAPTVRGVLYNSNYLKSVPRTPQLGASPGQWRQAMQDMGDLWATINTNTPAVPGFTPPLLLSGGYAQTAFVLERTALDTAFTAVATTDQNLTIARQTRDALFAPIYARLKQYRLAVAAALPVGHALAASIPSISPPAGSTPGAVNLAGAWDAGTDMANLTWSASTDPDLDSYSVRYHPGPRYKAAEEQTVSSVPAGTEEFPTDFGLVASGSTAWFKVYVVTTTGNEKGSNAVKIIRP